MEVKILSQENGMAEISVVLPAADLTAAIDKAFAAHSTEEGFSLQREGLAENPEARALLMEAVQALFTEVNEDIMKEIALPIGSMPKVGIVKANEEEGAEYTITFAIRPEMKLGRYKGIAVQMPDVTPTEEELNAELSDAAAKNLVPVEVARAAKLGDVAVIDFEGFQDGVAFEGGKGTDYALTLGSGQFIPGFEEQLVGASAGDSVDVNVTFPEQYHADQLAGKPALFKVTVKKVQEFQLAPLTEAQQEQVRQQVIQKKQNAADQFIEDQVLAVILEEAQVELPAAMIESEAEICYQQFAAEIEAMGTPIQQFCEMRNTTREEITREMLPRAKRQIELRMVLTAIAKAEGIVAEEAEVEQYWNQMSMQYGLSVEQLKMCVPPSTEAEIRAEIANSKAYSLLRESTVLVK